MAAKKKELKVWAAADLGLADNEVGRAGAMYDILEVLIPDRKSRVEFLTGTPEEAAAKLVEKAAQRSESFIGSKEHSNDFVFDRNIETTNSNR